MSIDIATVRQIAHLARIAVRDEEVDALAGELGRVLDFVGQLAQADISGVEPLAHPLDQALILREDVVTEPDQRDAFLALAPEAQSGLYLVPKVIE
jgi:aspartyl-tRNA(Asn)/glutamyl-tRNA(Gln) amidotransferase subunit C